MNRLHRQYVAALSAIVVSSATPGFAQDEHPSPPNVAEFAIESGVRHGPALEATYVTHRGREVLGFRVRTSLTGTKVRPEPIRLEFAVQIPEQADATALSLFLDEKRLEPWMADGEVIAFRPAPDLAERVAEVFMPAKPGLRWWGFRSDPFWGTRDGTTKKIYEPMFVSLSFANYPSQAEVGPHQLYLYRGSDAPDGSRSISYWPAYTGMPERDRFGSAWPWLIGGLVIGTAMWVRRRRAPGRRVAGILGGV